MFVAGFAAGPWATNCWVFAGGRGEECLIVDPGMDSLQGIQSILTDNKLKPIAVLLTHGHMDHMWSVTPVADGYGIPAVVHAEDRPLLTRPELAVSAQAAEMIRQLGGSFVEPAAVREVSEELTLELAGFNVVVTPAPGHTRGSVVYTAIADLPHMFSGDLLFKGSIGRTDLPGGDAAAMASSLRHVVGRTERQTVVHCGHGPDTTIGEELASNPFLAELRGVQHG